MAPPADHPSIVLNRSEPVFATRDVSATIQYYRDVLGFSREWFWDEPPTFGGAARGRIGVMFCRQPELAARIAEHQHYFFVTGVESLHAEHRERGAEIIGPLETKPWGLREYVVRDCNGYHLRFGERLGPSRGERGAPIPDVRYDLRLPTLDEYTALVTAVGWTGFVNLEVAPQALARSLFGAVGCVGDRVVAAGRVVGDGAIFFYLQDIMVLPEYQHHGIGTALVGEIMRELTRRAPRQAFVGLFTGRSLGPFYEQFGFMGPETFLYGMSYRKT